MVKHRPVMDPTRESKTTVAVFYSFVGPFPASYAVDSVKQTRLFHPRPRPIYFLVSDRHHPSVKVLEQEEDVRFLDTTSWNLREFTEVAEAHRSKFMVFPSLGDRAQLFLRAYERYFLLYRAWTELSATDRDAIDGIVFMECDNLIYANPREWFACMEKPMAYLYDHTDRCGAGLFLLRMVAGGQMPAVFVEWLQFVLAYLRNPAYEIAHEMKTLHDFWKARLDHVQMLPTHWRPSSSSSMADVPSATYESFEVMGRRIFDVAGIGILLGGLDPVHTGGVIQPGVRAPWSAIDYRPYVYEWRLDREGRRTLWIRPSVEHPDAYPVQNLHVHSKALKDLMS